MVSADACQVAPIRKVLGIRKRRPISLHLLRGAYKWGEERPVSGKIDLAATTTALSDEKKTLDPVVKVRDRR
jgi:hypothetical protein